MFMRATSLVFILCTALPAHAEDPRTKLSPGATATVTEVVDGDTVIVSPAPDGARQIRLVGIQAPKLPLGRKGFKAWPLSMASKQLLEKLVLNHRVTLHFGESRMDRHGRHLAHLFRDDGLWVQGAMLERGMARVYTFPDNRKLAAEMYASENTAHAAGKGIWGLRFYEPRGADSAPLLRQLGSFQLVEGRVRSAAKVKGRVYLNFGDNWRDDFTATLAPKSARLFAKTGVDATTLEGRRIRVRGWLRKRNGPMIEVSHPEQIEILED
ncbi:MAG: thermonuclease family protein [Rhodospirillaceae bacterium]|jgi:micrococcal nuclease|nr:thermonuclease family protein [Rhodospirillaceae bacterium]